MVHLKEHPIAQIIYSPVIGWMTNDELERRWKKAAVV
jgi:hypothetical protein